MFGGNQNPFGTNTAFGTSTFGTAQPAPFGQPTSAFGSTSAFGATSAPSTSGGLFGSTTQQTGGLFGSTGTTFGQPATSTAPSFGFGAPTANTSMFGAVNQQPAAGTGIFGTPAASFGQPRPQFGSFASTTPATGTSLFGQPQSTSLFGQTPAANTSLFGTSAFGTATVTSGTTIKFKPPTGTDTMMKNGVSSTISTSHQCITCMKEYENKSLEELRLEDYAANRKGGGQAAMGAFGATSQQGSIFSSQPTQQPAFNFGATQNKSLFGTSSTSGFAPAGGSLFGQTSQSQNVFGKTTGFGMTTPASTSAFGTSTGFGTTGTSVFGQPQQKSIFGQPTGTGLFGATPATTQASTGFGTGGFGTTFGATTQTNAFGVRPTFGATTTAATGAFGFGNTATTGTSSLFGAKQPAFNFGATTPAFGTTTTGFGGFSTPSTATGGLFGAPKTTTAFGTAAPAFGSTGFGTTPAFGTTGTLGAPATGGLFGTNTAAKPAGFGFGTTTTTTPFGGFGQTGLGTGTGFGTAMPTMGGLDPNAAAVQQQQQQTQRLLEYLSSNPYGDNPLFRNMLKETNKREELLRPTNPAAQQALLASQYKVSPLPAPKLRPKPVGAEMGKKSTLFSGLDDEEDTVEPFTPRRSIKKLVIKTKDVPDELSASSLLASTPSPALNRTSTPIAQPSGTPSRAPLTIPLKDSGHSPLTPNEPSFTMTSAPQTEKPKSNLQSLDDTVSALGAARGNRLRYLSGSDSGEDSLTDPAPDPSKPAHPAGIVLTRPGYYTIPSMKELAEMVGPDGRCLVENFAVVRDNYGSVFFPGLVDVTGLNLDEIVHFRRMEITVYPEDDDKPPLGEGLNREAQVTLDRVWPINKTSREPIQDPETLKNLGYHEKLERITAKFGGQFLDYRPETGSWVFKVKHFSKYGLDEPDNEVDQAAVQTAATAAKSPPQAAAMRAADGATAEKVAQKGSQPGAANAGVANMEVESAAGYGSDDDEMEDLEPSFASGVSDGDAAGGGASGNKPAVPVAQQLAETLGVSPEAVQSMKASFFARDEEDDEEEDLELAYAHPRLKRALVSSGSYQSPQGFHASDARPSAPAQPKVPRQDAIVPRHQPAPAVRRLLSDLASSHVLFGATPLPENLISMGRRTTAAAGLSDTRTGASAFHSPRFVEAAPHAQLTRRAAESMVIPVEVEPVPLVQSLFYEYQHLLADTSCAAGYRFRSGFGPQWTLTHLGKAFNSSLDDETMEPGSQLGFFEGQRYPKRSSTFAVSLERVAIDSRTLKPDDIQKKNLAAMLEVQLSHSRHSEERGSPIFVPDPGVDCLHDLDALVTKLLAEMGPGHADSAMMQQFHTILGLCIALWGRVPGCNPDTDDIRSYSYAKSRKDALSDWLVETTKPVIEAEIADLQREGKGELRVMLSHLSGRFIAEACAVAQRSRDFRLGLLLSQGGSNPVSRVMLQKQLDHWKKFKHDRYMEPERIRVYALLAGLMVWQTSDRTINCCADLDWKRALALHLWYHCSPTGSISDAVAAYSSAFQSDQPLPPYARPPYPPCHEDDTSEEPYALDPEAPLDTCFLLLKLYCDRSQRLDRLLAPVSSLPSQLDFRISWLLHKLVQSFGFSHLSRSAAATLHTSFAAQLESWGLWPWAVFALLHLETAAARHRAVTELLTRHVSGSRKGAHPDTALTEDESFVCDRLFVPPAWVYRAKAIRASSEGNHRDRAVFLLKGEIWNEAHETIIHHLATDAVIDEELEELAELLKPLSEHSADIQNWNTGGKVFLDLLTVCDTIKRATERDIGAYDLEAIRPTVLSLCASVSSLACKTPKDRLCQAEVAKKTSLLLQLITSTESRTPDSAMQTACRNIELLSMPDDYSITDLELLARSCAQNTVFGDGLS
ncbi:nuclear pore complex protein Nup98-96 isoform X1 [Haemaphysalis longicornis]